MDSSSESDSSDSSSGSEDFENLPDLENSRQMNEEVDEIENREIDQTADVIQNEVTVHETTWKFGDRVDIDAYKDTHYKPQLHVGNIQTMRELDFWLAFFPSEEIDNILRYTNARLRERRRLISKSEFYKVIGFIYAMSINQLHNRRDYWSVDSGLFFAPAFGRRFGMGLQRFEEILTCMAFTMPEENPDDKWYEVRPLIEMTTSKWRDIFSPGYKLAIDESMFAWYGKGQYFKNGMPAVIKIKRKPKGVGCECKTISDVVSGIMIGLEVNEGKEAMQQKEWQHQLGAGTATTLRLTRPWHGSGRIVVGDSWFGSVKTAFELHQRGLFFMGMVKTATKKYPIKEARTRCPQGKGEFVSATTTIDSVKLTCLAWRDKKIHTFVSTCSTTLPGEPVRKKRYDDEGNIVIKEVTRPKMVEEYFEGAPSIDIHNHIRQSGLALERVWNTQRWQHRMFASLFGIIETNAYLAYKYFKKEPNLNHTDFTEQLALQLINHPSTANPPAANDIANPRPAQEPVILAGNHTLIALSSESDKVRVQRKCIICSRVRKIQQKASYRCRACGPRAVMCSPTTGRNCFAHHVQHGIPA